MKSYYRCVSAAFLVFALLLTNNLTSQTKEQMKFVSADSLMIIGNGFEQSHEIYGRLPLSLKNEFRKELLSLGGNSAGLAVRFNSNSTAISVKWTVKNDFRMNHMPDTGIKGIDLYVMEGGKWQYAGTARPSGKESFAVVIKNMLTQNREYIAYFPLYDGVESVQIGVDSSAVIRGPQNNRLTKRADRKPIVFYGTSITQGGCASRPGMAYPAIIGRALDRETINLGFSGNARLDFSMAKAIALIEADAVVVDCLPNTTAQSVKDSAYVFISYLAEQMPGTVIYMVENPNFPTLGFNMSAQSEINEENSAWRDIFAQLLRAGFSNVEYIRGESLLGSDGEGTVDGVHLTDLGFFRFSQALMEYLNIFAPTH